MNKSIKKYYEHKRSYDYTDFNSPKGKRFNKKRAHKRARKQFEVRKGLKCE